MTNNHMEAMVSGIGQYHSCEQNSKNKTPYNPITFNKIRELVDHPPSAAKEEGQWFIPSSLMSRTFIEQETKGEFHCLWADFDKRPRQVNEIFDFWQRFSNGCDAEIYSTRSAKNDNPKSRIIIPLAEPISGKDWVICQQILNDKLECNGFIPDRAAERAAQLCYLPNRGEFYESASARNNKSFNPIKFWFRIVEDRRNSIARTKQDAEARAKEREEQREQRKANGYESLIDAFNDAYAVEDVLTMAGYDSINQRDWRHPKSESGSYSASIKDSRVFSLSSSDPLYTGGPGKGSHDAYSAFEVLFADGDANKARILAQNEWLAGWEIKSAKQDFEDISGPFDINAYFNDLALEKEDVSKMSEAEFLIQDVIVRGHCAVYIAPGNGGKTTLFVHFCEQLAAMGMTVLYVNVDGSPGDLKRHYEHASRHKYTVIAPDAKDGKSTDDVLFKLKSLAQSTHQLDNVVIVIDTLKKFVDVIQKSASKDFYRLLRTLTVRGATICLLGHANKYKDENGRHVFEGTADLRNDLDELIYLENVELENPRRLQITTDPDKVRADFKPRSFVIHLDEDRRVEDCKEAVTIQSPDSMTIIGLLKSAINEGNTSQKDIVSFVVERTHHGHKKVKQVLHENTGADQLFISRATGRGKELAYSIRAIVEEFTQETNHDFAV